MIDLQQLINKAQNKMMNRKETTEIPVSSLGGNLLFSRPKDAEILRYENVVYNAQKRERADDGTVNVVFMDLEIINDISRKLLVDNCEYLRNEEVLKALGVSDPYDVPKLLFADHAEVNNIAEQVYYAFTDEDAENTADTVKN